MPLSQLVENTPDNTEDFAHSRSRELKIDLYENTHGKRPEKLPPEVELKLLIPVSVATVNHPVIEYGPQTRRTFRRLVWNGVKSQREISMEQKAEAMDEGVRKINDELHEIYSEGSDDFEVIVIFFHGLVRCRDLDRVDGKIHISTWISTDEATNSEVLWPRVWLVEEFPKSRIYTVKYDSSIKATATAGISSLYILAENMMHSVILAFQPEFWCRPIVLVGHSFGGIVIKEFLRFAERRESNVGHAKEKMTISNFLENVKLIFYFATPHHGMDIKFSKLHVSLLGFWRNNEMIEEYANQLNPKLAQLDGEFGVIARRKGWLEAGLGELQYTRWDSIGFNGQVVSEASSRSRLQNYYSVHEDHFSISRPKSKTAGSFQFLVRYIEYVLPQKSEYTDCETQKPSSSRLNPSQILRAGDSLSSSNGVYRLVMQKDNNLVLKGRRREVTWSSNTVLNLPNCYCVMETNGSAVIYAVQEFEGDHHQRALWSTNTDGPDDASQYLEVQDDGNVVMYNEWRHALWSTNTWDGSLHGATRLTSGEVLERGAFIASGTHGYKLVLQDDCDLVLYSCATNSDVHIPIWRSNTSRSQKVCFCHFIMQADGDAVLYAGDSHPLTALWSTKTASQTAGTHYIEVQYDGNTVMYDAQRKAVWATNTQRGRPVCRDKITSGQIMFSGDSRLSLNRRYMLLMQWDGDLVMYKKGEGRIWASRTARQTYKEAAISCGSLKCYFIMKPNGSAEIYVGKNLLWSTHTNRETYDGTYFIEVQNDGNVVMYDRGSSRQQQWTTNTAQNI